MAVYTNANNEGLQRTSGLPAITNVTMCCWWYYANDSGGAPYRYALQLAQSVTGANNEFGISWNGAETSDNPALTTMQGNSNWANDAISTSATYRATSVWYFLAISSSGAGAGNTAAYLRRVGESAFQSTTNSNAQFTFTPAALWLGRGSWDGEWCDGRMAAFKMWDAALTSTELMAESHSYMPARMENLNCCHPLFNVNELNSAAGTTNAALATTGSPTTADGPPEVSWAPTQSPIWTPTSAPSGPAPLSLNYAFDDTSGTQLTDSGGANHHGTLIGDDGTNFWQP